MTRRLFSSGSRFSKRRLRYRSISDLPWVFLCIFGHPRWASDSKLLIDRDVESIELIENCLISVWAHSFHRGRNYSPQNEKLSRVEPSLMLSPHSSWNMTWDVFDLRVLFSELWPFQIEKSGQFELRTWCIGRLPRRSRPSTLEDRIVRWLVERRPEEKS